MPVFILFSFDLGKQKEHFLTHSLRSQYHPNTKSRQRYYMKGNYKPNTSYEHRCESPQQNIGKTNQTIYKKNYIT